MAMVVQRSVFIEKNNETVWICECLCDCTVEGGSGLLENKMHGFWNASNGIMIWKKERELFVGRSECFGDRGGKLANQKALQS